MEPGVYKFVLEIDLASPIKKETLEKLFRVVCSNSKMMTLLSMSEPVAADSTQAILETVLLEGLKQAILDEDLTRIFNSLNQADV